VTFIVSRTYSVCVCVTPPIIRQTQSVRYDTPRLQLCSHCSNVLCVCVCVCGSGARVQRLGAACAALSGGNESLIGVMHLDPSVLQVETVSPSEVAGGGGVFDPNRRPDRWGEPSW